jgi:dienelactone hydrolase
MYGKGIRGSSTEENAALMTPLIENRPELQSRIATALAMMREQPQVDATRCAAMGYCFGGLCVLDLARCGSDVAAVISIHGLFNPPGNTARHGDQRPGALPARVRRSHGAARQHAGGRR